MAPNTGKPVKLLVAIKKVTETKKTCNKLEYPVFSGTDGVYFIDDEDVYDEVLHSMTSICKKPVARISYTDSDNDEVPIDSEVEFKEALKFIGERTNKGKFTTLKIETENDIKNGKTKSKKSKAKVIPKNSEQSTKKPMKGISKKVKTDSSPNGESVYEASKSEITKAWLKKHLKELRSDIMVDLKVLLEPYISEQRRLSSMISCLQAVQIEKMSSINTNTKQQTESDHNYSALSNSKVLRSGTMSKKDSVKISPEQDETLFSEDEQECDRCEAECQCAEGTCSADEDENLSIYSGEISVTESESEPDEVPKDFIDVPFPSCFNVIAPQGATSSRPDQKNKMENMSSYQTSKQHKCTRPNTEGNKVNKKDKALKHNAKKSSIKQARRALKEHTPETNFSEPNRKGNINQKPQEKKSFDVESPGDERNKDVNKNDVDNVDEDAQEFDDFDNDDYEEEVDDDYEEVNDNKNNPSPSSTTSFQLNANQQEQRRSELNATVQGTDRIHPMQKYSSLQDDPLASAKSKSQFNPLPMTNAPPHFAPLSGQQAQSSEGFGASAVPLWPSASAQNCYREESQQIRQKPFQQQQLHQPMSSFSLLPQSPPTAETIIAQHHQIVEAARRAAYQAQQTQALIYPPTGTSQQQVSFNHASVQEAKSSFQDTQPIGCQNENVDLESGTPQANTSQAGNGNSHTVSNKTGTMHRLMQEAAHELKLWNEVDQVDLELHKWIKMCQFLMERPLKVTEDGEISKNFSPAAAAKTYQELEKVYQKFRKEVQLVSTQIDAQKQQKASGKKLPEDPIAILPEKLMQIISSTLNTTFNMLGLISKLGVVNPPTSGPSEEGKGAPAASFSTPLSAVEKPQQQASATLPAQMSGLGVIYSGQPMYYYPAQTHTTDFPASPSSSILADYIGNQESNIAYRVRPMGSYLPSLGKNVSTFATSPALNQTQNTMQVNSHMQPQNQQQQSQTVIPSQFQIRQPQIRQIPQQGQTLLQHPVMRQLQQQRVREDGNCVDPYTLQMHDPCVTHDANVSTIPLLYSNRKPNSAGFRPKAFGTAFYRHY
ncbi:Protein atp11, mitochondrial [Frankliniella fusca]|uniref:Protein atp11, mitochondrial n=1 Tax=Frankliniella fusca TaxID=407009 RepID=A0AAE1LK85_9NEOP|nr:Protein atp11, mitochondrial [Frankliniella fusca]